MVTATGSDALRQVPLFAGLGDLELASLAGELSEAAFPPGFRIFEAGDANSSLHVIREGKVKVVLPGNEEEVILKIFGDGDFFGELSLCDGKPRSAAVVAVEPTSTYVLPREVFLRFVESHPPAALRIMEALACRLRDTSERLSEIVFLDLPARLAKRLHELASLCGCATAGGIELPGSLTVDEIAPLVGATAAQVATEMRALDEVGIIDWDGTTVIVRAPALLAERTRGSRPYVALGHITVPRWLLEP
jgi:CRP/FNR family transcriptional regulator, cyclic AMP receptor protein